MTKPLIKLVTIGNTCKLALFCDSDLSPRLFPGIAQSATLAEDVFLFMPVGPVYNFLSVECDYILWYF